MSDVPIAFVDTETTSLDPERRRPWEIAVIRRDTSGIETTLTIVVEDVDLSDADAKALDIGRFYDRHPGYGPLPVANRNLPDGRLYLREEQAARLVEQFTRGAHLVGAMPHFDTATLERMFRRHRLAPSWHYHLIDVEALALGYLAGTGSTVRPPWRSDDLKVPLAAAVPEEHRAGITGSDETRHTAVGDARWAMAVYDAVMR